MSIASIIDRHVADWAKRPFTIGADDCAFSIRALYAETGATAAYANVVGIYRTADEIADYIAEETKGGGLVALVCQLARREGWRRIRPCDAREGDLGIGRGLTVVDALSGLRGDPFLAVRRGPMFVTRASFGVAALPPSRLSVAFSVQHGVDDGA